MAAWDAAANRTPGQDEASSLCCVKAVAGTLCRDWPGLLCSSAFQGRHKHAVNKAGNELAVGDLTLQ